MISLDYLRRDNPRLLQLEVDYTALDLPFGHTAWRDHQNLLSIEDFRSDGPYLGLGALRGEEQYRAMFDHVVSIDSQRYLEKLWENGDFGMHCYNYKMPNGSYKMVSRDLLDSIMEIYFVRQVFQSIQSVLQYSGIPMRWLDIGAGYGRLAYRLNTLFPQTTYVTCIDAVPISTFLCEFYTQYRECSKRVEVLPLTSIGDIGPGDFDIACNIHSWSECSASAIEFWLGKLDEWKVPYLFIVPHDERWVCVNEDGTIGNFRPNVLEHGWKEIYGQSKYPDGVDGLYPEVNYHMFERSV